MNGISPLRSKIRKLWITQRHNVDNTNSHRAFCWSHRSSSLNTAFERFQAHFCLFLIAMIRTSVWCLDFGWCWMVTTDITSINCAQLKILLNWLKKIRTGKKVGIFSVLIKIGINWQVIRASTQFQIGRCTSQVPVFNISWIVFLFQLNFR